MKIWIPCIQADMPTNESLEDSSNQPIGPTGSPRHPPWTHRAPTPPFYLLLGPSTSLLIYPGGINPRDINQGDVYQGEVYHSWVNNSWVYNSWIYLSWVYISWIYFFWEYLYWVYWVYLSRPTTVYRWSSVKAYCPLHLADLSGPVWSWCIKGNCLIVRFRVQVLQYGKASKIQDWKYFTWPLLDNWLRMRFDRRSAAPLHGWYSCNSFEMKGIDSNNVLFSTFKPTVTKRWQKDLEKETRNTQNTLSFGNCPYYPCNHFWHFFSIKKNIFLAGGSHYLGIAQKKGCFFSRIPSLRMALTQEVTRVELRIAVLFCKNLFKCSFQHAVLAGVTEALMSLAELWIKLFGTVEIQLLPAEPLKYGRNRRFIWISWLKTVGQFVYLHPGLCFLWYCPQTSSHL